MSRIVLGVIALLFLVGGGISMAFGLANQTDWFSGAVAVRVGAILGVLWLALPDIRRTSPRALLVAGAFALVIVLRPKLVLVVLPVALVLALLLPGRWSGRRGP